jgi:hypothetical protein
MESTLQAAADASAGLELRAANAARAGSATAWAAIFAGAAAAVAVTLILLTLGSGLGFAAISPWREPSPQSFAIATAIWLIVTQWIASGLGGYLTGRLRTRWTATHDHEVFFRDTAHGFLAWAMATIVAVALLGLVGAGATGTATRLAAGSGAEATPVGLGYDIDWLFRSTHPSATPALDDARAQAQRILIRGAAVGAPSPDDQVYLAALVAANADIAQTDAELRVTTVVQREQAAVAEAKAAADKTRKASAALSIFTALSMLVGAFIACVAAALGGQQRDEHL